MKDELIEFHRKCVPEYLEFLKNFNIMFYGYGDKFQLLNEMFPNANFINTFSKDLLVNGINIICSFNFKKIDPATFPKNNTICTIDTMDPLQISLCDEDLEEFNFILKDLTTYVPYDYSTLENKKEISLKNLLQNISKRSNMVFKILVGLSEKNTVLLSDLINTVKKEVFINDINTIHQLLSEFVDHKIIKYKDGKIVLLMKKEKIIQYFEE